MAKRTNDKTPQRQNSSLRVRWVEVELNGSDTSIEEALRTVERMRRPVIEAPAASKRITGSSAPVNHDNGPSDDPTFSGNGDHAPVSDESSESVADFNGDNTAPADVPRKRRGEGGPKDRNMGIKLVGDIDFIPNGKQPLKDLFAEKSPNTDMDQSLVICYFLQHTLGFSQFGPNTTALIRLKFLGRSSRWLS